MRTKLLFGILLVLASLAATAGAQSNTFTYQGRLTDNNLAAVGTYEMQFRVFDAAVAGNQLPVGTPVTLNFTVAGTNPVTVSNGAFTIQLNFGNGVFTGADRWLEISVRKPSDPPGFTLLTPRQPITSSPYSIKTLNAASADSVSCNLCITDAQISGIDAGKVTGVVGIANGGTGSSTQNFVDLTTPQTITGAKIMSSATNVFTGSGAGLTNISPTNISPGTASINIAGIAAAPAVVTSGATPSVAGRTMLTLDYATPTEITDLTGGVDGQCVVLLSLNNNISFATGGNFRLAITFDGYVSKRVFSDSALTVCRSSASGSPLWYETSRAINSVVNRVLVQLSGTGTGTVNVSPSGSICSVGGLGCAVPVPAGESVTLTAISSPDSTFTGWSGGSCSGTGTCTLTPTAAVTAVANFTLNTYQLSVTKTAGGFVTSVPAGISCGTDCSETYTSGTVVTLTRGLEAGATFIGWGGACSGTNPVCFVTMDAAKSVTATFGINLTVTKAGAGTGTVTSNPGGINCGANCSAFFAGDSLPVLTAVADPGSVFLGWTGSGCSGTGTCTQQMNTPRSVTATFAPQQFTLSVAKAGAGSGTVTSSPAGINCGADCSEPYNNGTTVTLTAAPSVGSTFSGWSGGGCSGTGTCTTTVTAATTVTATFAPQQFNLSVSLAGTGSGLVTSSPAGISCGADCSELYNAGTTVTLTATTFGGTTFSSWSGGCSGTLSTCTVTIIAAATVTATFTSLGPALLTLTPTSRDFGSTVLGLPTATVDFTVTNTGGASSGSIVTQLTGTDATEFQITADTCLGNVLFSGGTCTVTVRFNPMAAGNRAATLSVQATPGGSPTSTLTGIGI